MNVPRIRRLAILRLSAIGDVVHAMPLAMGLRKAYPEAWITWVVQERAAPLLENHPAVDRVLIYPRRGGARVWTGFLRELRAARFDATVDPQGNLKSGAVGLASGAPLRAGLNPRDCKEWVNALFTNRHGRRPRGLHGVDRAWAAGGPLGVLDGPDDWGLHATELEREAWFARCKQAGADPGGPLLALHLTDPRDARSWFPEAWAETAATAARAGWQVILNGTAAQRPLAAAMKGPGVFDMTGRDDLRGLLAQFEAMAARPGNLLVSPDSGPVHLAVAAGLFVLCLAGPQDPRRTGPRSGGAWVAAREGLDCAPCLERKCILRPPERLCMRNLSPASVFRRIQARAARELSSRT